jgi:hypothetical protein
MRNFGLPPFFNRALPLLYERLHNACDNEEPLHIYNVNLVRLRTSAGSFDKDGGIVETIARSQLKLREHKIRGLNQLFNNLRDGNYLRGTNFNSHFRIYIRQTHFGFLRFVLFLCLAPAGPHGAWTGHGSTYSDKKGDHVTRLIENLGIIIMILQLNHRMY